MSIAIIGGSGLDLLPFFNDGESITTDTPYGKHSGPILTQSGGVHSPTFFLPRHGSQHEWPPHLVNYRANIWMLKSLGVKKIIACNVVGGITEKMSPATLLVPHQLIDYTWGREQTFFSGAACEYSNEWIQPYAVEHYDFTHPYTESLRQKIMQFLTSANIHYIDGGVYGCTQGPRLETAAEIQRMKKDGCDIVGMTSMPEAILARELDMEYVCLSLVVNWAPGITTQLLSIEKIMETISAETKKVCQFMPNLLNFLS
jgi:5'-methylthioinosine phosphorylase